LRVYGAVKLFRVRQCTEQPSAEEGPLSLDQGYADQVSDYDDDDVKVVVPRAGSRFERLSVDLLRFLAGCRKRRLNQAVSVLSLSLVILSVSVVLLTRATFCVVLFVCSVS